MIAAHSVGKRIAMLRKEKNLSQEQLAEQLQVSAQAVSKWETGKALPDTATLPLLARSLGHTIDSILVPQELVILSAVYTDGLDSRDLTAFLQSFAVGDRLTFPVSDETLPVALAGDRTKVLLVKYQTSAGCSVAYAWPGTSLRLGPDEPAASLLPEDAELTLVDAVYGNARASRNVMNKFRHLAYFRWNAYPANQELFPSLIENEGNDYLLLLYRNADGLHAVSCREGEEIRYNEERTRLFRSEPPADRFIAHGVAPLAFGQGQDCSWGGALLASLTYSGIETTYEELMGVSGACWRVAFTPVWDYSAADALVAYDYAAPGFAAYGIRPIWSDRPGPEERKRDKALVVDSLRAGQLPVGINLRVAPEWGVITGFLDGGNALLCRTYFDRETFDEHKDDPDFQAEMDLTKGYLYVDQWPFALVRWDEREPVPSRLQSLLRSLRIKRESMGLSENRGYRMGYLALESWRDALLDEGWYRTAADADLVRRLDVNHFLLRALTDARRCAAAYLRQAAAWSEAAPAADLLSRMADLYERMHATLAARFAVQPDEAAVKAASVPPHALWTPELRTAQAEELTEAIRLEQEGDRLAAEIAVLLEG
ncbi:helix-turn-helix transcriptional regulator [Gorillibacterium sp. sgz500922]|uniref:helix-turn-helix transcriptional regulator n=1 Tax=Gorillibacterium sp. sgz500922 TaxID=3446694 RepID=UPI003F67080C